MGAEEDGGRGGGWLLKPASFDYEAPTTLSAALALLAAAGDEAKVLAGGQSLVPLLNLRLARPARLVDVNRVPGLDAIRLADGHLTVGALVRHRAVERSDLVRRHCPLLHQAVGHIGHVQIRNRGTVGGSLAHADPAAELPAVMAALGATLILTGVAGERAVPARDFFRGFFATALQPGELLTAVRVPGAPPGTGSAFLEVARRHGDFALCGVAAQVQLDPAGRVTAVWLGLTGVGPGPVVPADACAVLVGELPTAGAIAAAADKAAAACDPEDDIHASAEYRRHVAGVLTRRALTAAIAAASGGEGG